MVAGVAGASAGGVAAAFLVGATAGSWIPVIGSIIGGTLAALAVGWTTEKAINAICDKCWFENEEDNNLPEIKEAHLKKIQLQYYKRSMKIL